MWHKVLAIAALAALATLCNAHAQDPVFTYPPPASPLGFCSLSVGASVTTLAACPGGIPKGASFVLIDAESASVRYRDDGINPTATVGMPMASLAPVLTYASQNLGALSFIAQSGTATLDVLFYSK
jgi:hypothetical protein